MLERILASLAAVCLFTPGVFSQDVQNAHAVRAAQLMEQLRQIPIQENPTDVPASAKPLLTDAKREIRDFLAGILNEQETFASLDEFRSAAINNLENAGMKFHFIRPGTTLESDDPEYDKFGYLSELKISEPEEHPELRAVVVTFQIPCGSDSTFSVFQKEEAGWKRILTEEADGYDKISGALGSFDYAVSPSAGNGSWFVLTANVNPWCSSDWQSIRYKVQRPGVNPDQPSIIFTRNNGVFLGEDEVYKLSVAANDFKVAYFGDEPLDTTKLIRVHTDHFQFAGEEILRIPPVALAPHEFIDEWMQLPWTEAAPWAAADVQDALKTWHDRLNQTNSASYTSEFEFAQPCEGNGPERWQVGLSLHPDRNGTNLPKELFFTVGRESTAYFMQDISDHRAPGCPGEASPADSWSGFNLP